MSILSNFFQTVEYAGKVFTILKKISISSMFDNSFRIFYLKEERSLFTG